jgi:hypothetical protein
MTSHPSIFHLYVIKILYSLTQYSEEIDVINIPNPYIDAIRIALKKTPPTGRC